MFTKILRHPIQLWFRSAAAAPSSRPNFVCRRDSLKKGKKKKEREPWKERMSKLQKSFPFLLPRSVERGRSFDPGFTAMSYSCSALCLFPSFLDLFPVPTGGYYLPGLNGSCSSAHKPWANEQITKKAFPSSFLALSSGGELLKPASRQCLTVAVHSVPSPRS